MRFSASFLLLLVSVTAMAAPNSMRIKALAELHAFQVREACVPRFPSCFDALCAKLGTLGCDNQGKVREALVACQGNANAFCFSVVCDRLGSLGCTDRSEVFGVAAACRGNLDGECVSQVCDRLGRFGCDEESEVHEVARSCAGF